MFSQTFLALTKVRHHRVHFIPEHIGVVSAMEVTQLMHHDVVDDSGRSHHGLSMEIELSAVAATGPAVLFDHDAAQAEAAFFQLQGASLSGH